MLGIDQKTGRAQEWLPAVLLDKQLYLFDTELGLPVPGPGGQGIATLAQVRGGPSAAGVAGCRGQVPVPRARIGLGTGRGADRRVAAVSVAAHEACGAGVGRRGPDDLELFRSADLKQELADCPGIKDVRLWAVPFEANMYQQARGAMMAQQPGNAVAGISRSRRVSGAQYPCARTTTIPARPLRQAGGQSGRHGLVSRRTHVRRADRRNREEPRPAESGRPREDH